MKPLLLTAVLAVGVLASAITMVYARHEARAQFAELQTLIGERDAMAVEWGRLRLEQSTQSTHSRVERLARQKMSMRPPTAREIMVVPQ